MREGWNFGMANWILIRGLGRHSIHWGDFTEILKKALPHDHFEFLDIRGNGNQGDSRSCLTIAENVKNLSVRSKFVNRGEKVNLIGISMGGMIALEWAYLNPSVVNRVVCINSSERRYSFPWQRFRPQGLRLLNEIWLGKKNSVYLETQILNLTTNLIGNKKSQADYFATSSTTSPANLLRQLFAASKFKASKPPCRVTFICSKKDRLVNFRCTTKLAEAWDSEFAIHPSAGHDLPLDDPLWITQKLIEI